MEIKIGKEKIDINKKHVYAWIGSAILLTVILFFLSFLMFSDYEHPDYWYHAGMAEIMDVVSPVMGVLTIIFLFIVSEKILKYKFKDKDLLSVAALQFLFLTASSVILVLAYFVYLIAGPKNYYLPTPNIIENPAVFIALIIVNLFSSLLFYLYALLIYRFNGKRIEKSVPYALLAVLLSVIAINFMLVEKTPTINVLQYFLVGTAIIHYFVYKNGNVSRYIYPVIALFFLWKIYLIFLLISNIRDIGLLALLGVSPLAVIILSVFFGYAITRKK